MEREVDNVRTTMNVEDLNRLVVSLRHTSKLCKAQTIQKITRKIAIYKNKRGTKKEVEQNLNKCQKLLEEIQIIKIASSDELTKYALCSSLNLNDVTQKGNLKDIAFTRVSCHNVFKNFVEDWRTKHSDWKSLSAFLDTQISRRYKKKKNSNRSIKKIAKLVNIYDRITIEQNTIDQSASSDVSSNESLNENTISIASENIANFKTRNNKDESLASKAENNKIEITVKKDDITKDSNLNILNKQNISKKKDKHKDINLGNKEHNINKSKINTNVDVNYREGNIIVKQFNLDDLNEEDEIDVGPMENMQDNCTVLQSTTKDMFFLQDGESGNEGELMQLDEETADVDETEFRGKYPNRSNHDSRSGNKFNKKNDAKEKTKYNNCNYKSNQKSNMNVGRNKSFNTVRREYNNKCNYNKSNLHPSWAASKKKKDEQAIVKFQGKKIVFSD